MSTSLSHAISAVLFRVGRRSILVSPDLLRMLETIARARRIQRRDTRGPLAHDLGLTAEQWAICRAAIWVMRGTERALRAVPPGLATPDFSDSMELVAAIGEDRATVVLGMLGLVGNDLFRLSDTAGYCPTEAALAELGLTGLFDGGSATYAALLRASARMAVAGRIRQLMDAVTYGPFHLPRADSGQPVLDRSQFRDATALLRSYLNVVVTEDGMIASARELERLWVTNPDRTLLDAYAN